MLNHPTHRIAVFGILLFALMFLLSGLSGQILKFGNMLIAVTMAPVPQPAGQEYKVPIAADQSGGTGATMKTLEAPAAFLNFLIVAAVVLLVLSQWMRTPLPQRVDFLKTLFLYEALILGVIVVLFPFFWMLCTSFKPAGTELKFNLSNPFDVVPAEPTSDNFRKVLKAGKDETVPGVLWRLSVENAGRTLKAPFEMIGGVLTPLQNIGLFQSEGNLTEQELDRRKNFGTYFMNSLQIAGIAAFLVTLFSAMAGYVFAKKELPYKETVFSILLGTMMIPGMMYMVPQFFMICQMGLFGTKWAMFLPHLASVFGVFMLKQFMETIPTSLIEAARIDGASEWQIFRIIIVPLSMPVLLTLFLLTFLFHWSNFLWQLIVTDFENPLSITLPVGLSLFRGQYTSDLGLIMSASCFSIVPIAILFLIAQRYFIEGMTQGAVKE